MSSLSNYFDQLIAKEDQALQRTRDQLAQMEQRRDQAREVRKYYDKLDLYQQQLASATEQRTRRRDEAGETGRRTGGDRKP